MSNIILYTTVGCHLCEQAQAIVETLCRLNGLQWQAVDIADDLALAEHYGLRIPVIKVEGAAEDIGWPFDEATLINYLQAHLPAE
jgi:glutaredoxin